MRAALVRWVVLLLLVPKAALGTPRRIAFVNVARDPARVQNTIEHLRPFILKGGEWVDLGEGPARQSLEGPLDPDTSATSEAVTRATALLSRTREAFAQFEYDTALAELRQTEVLLRGLAPHPAVVGALAEMNLLEGLVRLGQGDADLALEAFRVVRRLAPDRSALDAGTYRPQVVLLYEQAGKMAEHVAHLLVTSEPAGGTVWVDGQNVGTAPVSLPRVASGAHYVAVVLEGHVPRGEKIRLEPRAEVSLPLLLSRLPAEDQARSVRVNLLDSGLAKDDWRRLATRLCDAVSVDVLVLFRQREDQGIEHAVYESKNGSLSDWTEPREGEAFVAALPRSSPASLLLTRVLDPSEQGMRPPLAGDDTGHAPRWYRTWWGTAAIASAVVLATGLVLLSTAAERDPGFVVDRPEW